MPRPRESYQAAARMGGLRTATLTILDVYEIQVEMQSQLAVIREQLKVISDHEARIRQLETAKSRIYGAAAVISVIVSSLGTWVGILLTHH
jgi:predicted regulator of amino acid metabolism with ACT domain